MLAPLLKNSTVPVGVPVPGLITVTVAVSVTDSPWTDGFGDEMTVVSVSSMAAAFGDVKLTSAVISINSAVAASVNDAYRPNLLFFFKCAPSCLYAYNHKYIKRE
jgi:hypothetical protein